MYGNKHVIGRYYSGGFYELIVTETEKYFIPLHKGYKCES